MNNKNFSITFSLDQSAKDVFDAITNVPEWWSEDFEGTSHAAGDEFAVRFGDVHYSKQKLTEVIPGKKIVWLVTESHLNFLRNKSEWTGTHITFEIAQQGPKTQLHFTHLGLVPEIECFSDCSKGWNHYLKNSLIPFITTGKAQPNKPAVLNVTNK